MGATMTTEMNWASGASCVGKYELFFEDNRPSVVRKAKALCRGCAVRKKCLEHALENGEVGLWGGMTANERRVYRVQMKRGIEVA